MTKEATELESVIQKWDALNREFADLENLQSSYSKTVDEFKKLKIMLEKESDRHMEAVTHISQSLQGFSASVTEENEQKNYLISAAAIRKEVLKEIKSSLPKKNGQYLRIVLGNVDVTLLSQDAKYKYKDEYEQFKLAVTVIILLLSVLNIMLPYSRTLDALLHFLLVWYYCTLTIRESILKVNGSRIKGWSHAHHFITAVLCGVLILWPDGVTYQHFRMKFMWYSCYTSFQQFLQYYYQQGCLYRLRSLGERYNMDITMDGFHSWMWRGLQFLLLFLMIDYCWQLYNAYTLFQICVSSELCEWQIGVSSVIFFVLFVGNSLTTALTIPQVVNWVDSIFKKLR